MTRYSQARETQMNKACWIHSPSDIKDLVFFARLTERAGKAIIIQLEFLLKG